MVNLSPLWDEASLPRVLDEIAERHYAIWPEALCPALLQALRQEVEAYAEEGQLQRAGIGRGEDFHTNTNIRRDKTRWLTGQTPAQEQFLAVMEQVRQQVNSHLFMGLNRFEAHYACYEPGAFYARHLDAFRDAIPTDSPLHGGNRRLSTVLYLNPDWQDGDGGELCLYAPDDPERLLAMVTPQDGVLALFLSAEIPHEVKVTRTRRYSIAGWFR